MNLTAATIIIIILYAHLNNGFIASSKKYMSYKTKKKWSIIIQCMLQAVI